MMNGFNYGAMQQWGNGYHFSPALAGGIALLALWSLFWKGLALWHSAKKGQNLWFVLMLVLNTAGILEIIYLFGVLKLKFDDLFKK